MDRNSPAVLGPVEPTVMQQLVAERDELRRQVHNLNWALSMPGFEQMATPEDQAEHEAGAAAVDAVLARMEHNKKQHDAMVKDAERWRKLRDTPATLVTPGPLRGWIFSRPGADSLDRMADALPTVGAA